MIEPTTKLTNTPIGDVETTPADGLVLTLATSDDAEGPAPGLVGISLYVTASRDGLTIAIDRNAAGEFLAALTEIIATIDSGAVPDMAQRNTIQ